MRFVRPVTRRIAALGVLTGVLVVAGIAGGGGRALAGTPAVAPAVTPAITPAANAALLSGSSSATLTQVSAGEWTTTVFLDTAALCAGDNPAGNAFSLVTVRPNTVTGAAAPAYTDGPLACGAVVENPVTQVKLTFSPSLSAVPLTATLTVTPPQALLMEGYPPVQIPLTVRRAVSPWQFVGIPAICGGALAALLVLLVIAIGLPGKEQTAPPGRQAQVPEPGLGDYNVRLLLFLMHKRHELLLTEMCTTGGESGPVAARPVAVPVVERPVVEGPVVKGPVVKGKVKRVRWGPEFWQTPLFAGAAWSFGDSWATSVTPLTALAGGVLTASGAVAGLVPGVDLTRFGLLMALVGGLTTIAPLLFSALNSLFSRRKAAGPAPTGEVTAASLWVMLLASCLTVFAIGAEIGFVGLVLGFDLIVASPETRWIGPAVTGLAAILFLAYGAHSILTLAGQPSGTPKNTAKKSSFMI